MPAPLPAHSPQQKTSKNLKDMPFLNHLEELRKRLIYSLLAIGLCFIFTYLYSEVILQFLMQPALQILGEMEQAQLHFTGLIEPFLTHLKVAFYAAIFLSSPLLFYQIWKFVAPGLYLNERWILFSLVFFSSLTFIIGLSFAYYMVFPFSFHFFLSFISSSLKPVLTIGQYLTLTLRLLLGFGLVFELPIIVVVLSLAGILDGKKVAYFWRYALVATAILSAALTPPDLASMLIMMIPLNILYLLSIILATLFSRKKN